MKKIIFFLMILFVLPIVFSAYDDIDSFYNQDNPFILDLDENIAKTIFVSFPLYALPLNMSVNFTSLSGRLLTQYYDRASQVHNTTNASSYHPLLYLSLDGDFSTQSSIVRASNANFEYETIFYENFTLSKGEAVSGNLSSKFRLYVGNSACEAEFEVGCYNFSSSSYYTFILNDTPTTNIGGAIGEYFFEIPQDCLDNTTYVQKTRNMIKSNPGTCFASGSSLISGYYESAITLLQNISIKNLTIGLKVGEQDEYFENLTDVPINISGVTIDKVKSTCNCKNCSIAGSSCIIPINITLNDSTKLKLDLLYFNYSYGIDNCSNYKYHIANFTYKDTIEGFTISADNAYDLTLISPFNQVLQGNFKEQYNSSICSLVNTSIINYTFTGDMTLSKGEYGTQIYDYGLGNPLEAFYPGNQITLFLSKLQNTSTIVYTWRTNNFNNVDGTMEIYECLGDGSKRLIASNSIINGEASANIELLNTPYSYEIIYEGERYIDLDSYSKCHIETQTTRLYILQIGQEIAPITGLYSIPCNLTKTGNLTYMMEWGTNPESSSLITGCVDVLRQTVRGSTIVDTICSNSSGISGIVSDSGFTYVISGALYQNGYTIGCAQSIAIETGKEQSNYFGITGILSIFILIVGTILLFANENPKFYPIMGLLGVILAWILGILAFGWVPISSLVAFVIIIVILGRRGKTS